MTDILIACFTCSVQHGTSGRSSTVFCPTTSQNLKGKNSTGRVTKPPKPLPSVVTIEPKAGVNVRIDEFTFQGNLISAAIITPCVGFC